jgi:hypothetical protein
MSGIIAVYGLVVAVLIAGSRMSLCCLLLSHCLVDSRSQTCRIFVICGIHSSRRRFSLWLHRNGSRLCYWNRWRFCGFFCPTLQCYAQTSLVSARVSQRVKDICYHGPYSHFRRSAGTLRVSRISRYLMVMLTHSYRLIVALIMNTKASGVHVC